MRQRVKDHCPEKDFLDKAGVGGDGKYSRQREQHVQRHGVMPSISETAGGSGRWSLGARSWQWKVGQHKTKAKTYPGACYRAWMLYKVLGSH